MAGSGPRAKYTVNGKLWDANKKRILDFQNAFVEVGVFEGEQHEDEDGTTPMAMIAAVHEYGSEKRGIPERSYMRSWVDEAREKIEQMIQKLYNATADGKMAVEQAMKLLGQFGVAGIRQQITKGDFVPLKPATIARKKSSKPLIDTGQLRDSIHSRTGKGAAASKEGTVVVNEEGGEE